MGFVAPKDPSKRNSCGSLCSSLRAGIALNTSKSKIHTAVLMQKKIPHLPSDDFITRGRVDNRSAQVSPGFALAETLMLKQRTPAQSVSVEPCCDMVPLQGHRQWGYHSPVTASTSVCCLPSPLKCSQAERALTNLRQRDVWGVFYFKCNV